MASLLDTLKSTGSIKTLTISESSFFKPKDVVQTSIPIINVAFTGTLDGGIAPGVTMIAGPSKHFKSNLGLVAVRAYQQKYPDAICLFYDSEFGCTPEYLEAHGIDPERTLHIPIEHIEQLKFDIVKKLDAIKNGDKVIIFVDSLGNLPSKKEVEDAEDEKSVADMTRAKQIKSLFRIITPKLTIKNLPCIVINHTYDEQALHPRKIVSGGTGAYYSSNIIWIVSRQQDKSGTDVVGWNFTINIEKSRYHREKSKLSFNVKYDGGIDRFSGLLDLALEFGWVTKPSNGWYLRRGDDVKKREAETSNMEFFKPILMDKEFRDFVATKYCMTHHSHVMNEVGES